MNGMMYYLPWTIPGPIGIVAATGFAPLSFLLVLVMIVVDVLIFLPFFRQYDKQLVAEEAENTAELAAAGAQPALAGATASATVAAPAAEVTTTTVGDTATAAKTNSENYFKEHEVNVMVICAGGGTSGILANALNKLSKERGLKLSAAARAYGQDMDLIQNMDMVILAPQMESMKGNLEKLTSKYGVKLVTTTGRQYIALTNDGDMALEFVESNL
jgi:PTS system lactose-specific IIC component